MRFHNNIGIGFLNYIGNFPRKPKIPEFYKQKKEMESVESGKFATYTLIYRSNRTDPAFKKIEIRRKEAPSTDSLKNLS